MTNLPILMLIKPNEWPTINRPQRVLVRQHYRMLRAAGLPRVRAHMVVRSLIDVGWRGGDAAARLHRQWPIDKGWRQ